ncbi:MAG TPA: hypothetical protein PK339_12575 [Flavitalea sp.]|nr:hypothetical protein [Flavitalea sp.]
MLNALERSDKMAITLHLSGFKQRGMVDYARTLQVPTFQRITAMASDREGYSRLLIAISAAIRSALANINLRVSLTEDQIVELADQIIDQANEDNLALEDVLLFLQQLVGGKAGKIYDRLDIPVFFELFETYRQSRHIAMLEARYEQDANYKALGPTERMKDDLDAEKQVNRAAMASHLRELYSKKEQQ